MSLLEILTYPDRFLRTIASPVKNIDENIQHLIQNMGATMYHAPGAGLAAVQVGSDKKILVFDELPGQPEQSLQALINPTIIEREGVFISENEGCLSVPELRSDVKRSNRVLVEAVDKDGNPLRFEAEGFLAVVLQHEIDHLNGTLFIDHLSALKRNMYKKRMKKQLRNR
jgi:peptide deformylase